MIRMICGVLDLTNPDYKTAVGSRALEKVAKVCF